MVTERQLSFLNLQLINSYQMTGKEDTICAPATSGGGAIAVIRMSGSQSISICNKIFSPADRKTKLPEQKGYSIVYGDILEEEEVVDDVLVSVFRAPLSYTGEDSIEISCHASKYIQQKILELLVRNGASPASPGEFTRRAFLNGKMDLSQAEAVADLIASQTSAAHKLAVSQMKGKFSGEIGMLRAELLHFASLIELELDFGEEDVEFADRKKLSEIVARVLRISRELTSSFSLGNAVKNGVPVVIIGKPNTGKSTLLNRLLQEERAIVSEIPGTTRDAIEDTVNIEGIQYRFIDTAGLRETGDIIENLGIQRTHEKIDIASVIFLVADVNEGIDGLMIVLDNLRTRFGGTLKKIFILVNKIDNDHYGNKLKIKHNLTLRDNETLLFISSKTGEGTDILKEKLAQVLDNHKLNTENVIITNVRHYNALLHVTDSLERVMSGLQNSLQEDLIAIDIRQAIHYLGEITGQITTDEILGNIFKNFCIGK